MAAPPADGVIEAATAWLTAGGDGRLGPEPTIDRLLAVGRRFAFHTSSTVTHVSGMASIAADGSVHEITTHSDGGLG